MDTTEKNIELLKILSSEYMDKHHHYWNIYFKFLLGLAFTMSLYVFGEKNIETYVQANSLATAIIFSIVVILMGAVSFLVLSREHLHLLNIRACYSALCKEVGLDLNQITQDTSRQLPKIESFFAKLLPIASVMSLSIILITVACVILIILKTVMLGTP